MQGLHLDELAFPFQARSHFSIGFWQEGGQAHQIKALKSIIVPTYQ